MSGALAYLLFKILPTILVALLAVYLVYVRVSPTRYKAILARRKKGTPAYAMYEKAYSSWSVASWVCIALFFVAGVAIDIYRSTHTPTLLALYLLLAASLAILLMGPYVLRFLFKKK